MTKAQKHILSGVEALKKPKFALMNQEDRLLRVALMAYLKHSGLPQAEDIGWEELSEALHNEICNTIGDNAYCRWSERMRANCEVED